MKKRAKQSLCTRVCKSGYFAAHNVRWTMVLRGPKWNVDENTEPSGDVKKSKCISGLRKAAVIVTLLFGCMFIGDISFVSRAEDTENAELDEDGIVYGDFRYGEAPGGAYITAYKGTDSVVTIPDAIGDLPVIKIYSGAFKDNTTLTSVSFPACLSGIGENAFDGCSSLETVEFREADDKVTEAERLVIDEYAFVNCGSLTAIDFPEYTTEIGEHAFAACGFGSVVKLPKNLIQLGDYAFAGCTDVSQVDIEGGLSGEHDGDYAFSGCTSLNSVEFGIGVKTVAKGMFSECTALNSVTLSDSIIRIEDSAFYGCTSIKKIVENARETNIKFPDGLGYIGNSAFEGCDNLDTVVLPDGYLILGDRTFKDCTKLTSIELSKNLLSVGTSTFENCTGLSRIDLSENMKSTGHYTFKGCTGLTYIYVSKNTDCYDNIFDDCNLSGLVIHTTKGDSDVNKSAIELVAATKNIKVEYETAPADEDVFEDEWHYLLDPVADTATITQYTGDFDNDLSTDRLVHVPSEIIVKDESGENAEEKRYTVTAIGDYAFAGTTELNGAKVIVPDTVKSIGKGAFANADIAKLCIYGTKISEIGNAAFSCSYPTKVYTRAGSGTLIKYLKDNAVSYTTVIENITIPATLTVSGNEGSGKLPVTIEPENALDELAWDAGTTDNEDIADVMIGHGNNATILTYGKGTTKITISYVNELTEQEITASCNVTVTDDESSSDSEDPNGKDIGEDGSSENKGTDGNKDAASEAVKPSNPANPGTTTTPATPTTPAVQSSTESQSNTVVKPTVNKVNKLKVSGTKEKQIKCTWKKLSGAEGYQLQYSTNKKYKNAKTVKLTKKSTSKKLTKLKSGTKYYIRIRAYKTYTDESGEKQKVYGKWVAKNIKCK